MAGKNVASHHENGWLRVTSRSWGVFLHTKTEANTVVYVDDMFFLGTPRDTSRIWRALEIKVDFVELEFDIERKLGARYRLDVASARHLCASRAVRTVIDAYARNATDKFQKEYGRKLDKVASKYRPRKEVSKEGRLGGMFLHIKQFE